MYVQEPFLFKEIKDINPNIDFRVFIIARVLDSRGDSLVVDDGTGNAIVDLSSETIIKANLKENKLVRIFGVVLPTEPLRIQSSIIQDFSDLDLDVFKKFKEICYQK